MNRRITTFALSLLGLPLLSSAAHAFDPFEGAEPTPVPAEPKRPAYSSPARAATPSVYNTVRVAPAPYAAAPAPMPAALPTPAPRTVNAYVAAPVAPAAPAYPAYESYATPPVAPLQAYPGPAPVAMQASYTPTYAPQPVRNRSYFGIEGYRDSYAEDASNIDNTSLGLSVVGKFEHHFSPTWFGTVDGRVSRGWMDSDTPQGKATGIAEWEGESRLTTGYDLNLGDNGHLKPYVGLGGRFYKNDAKSKSSDLSGPIYSQQTWQLYAPVGVTYEFHAFGLNFAPNIEYGRSLYSSTRARSEDDTVLPNFSVRQKDGYQLRGEFMIGEIDSYGAGFECGPFFRYWKFDDSETKNGLLIPENDRLQIGATARLVF